MPLLLLAAVFGLITSLYLVSCNKNNEINDPQDRTASAVLDRNGDTPFSALTVSAINHKGTEDYEFAGQTLYEHRMFFSHRDPLTYFNFSPEEKAAIDVATAEFNLKFKDLETPEAVIAKMQSEGLISATSQMDYMVNYYNQLIALFDNLDSQAIGSESPDFGTVYFAILDLENSIKLNNSLTQEQKNNILRFSSIIRNELKYEVASGQIEERGGKCWGGIKRSCWLKYGFGLALKITAYSILIPSGPVYALLLAEAIISFTIKINDKDCKCDGGDPLFACNAPDGIVLEATPCSNIQTVKAIGYGTHGGQFQWSLDLTKVIAVDYPGVAEPITDVHKLRVQMVGSVQTANIGVKLIGCPDPETFPYSVTPNMPIAAAAGIGSLFISGDDVVLVGVQKTYKLAGTALATASAPYTMGLSSGSGTVLGNTGNTINIQWPNTPGVGVVYGSATACTGQPLSGTKVVTIKQ